MDIYLLRHGDADMLTNPDIYSSPLTSEGQDQAAKLAGQCVGWDIQFLITSTMARALETADVISEALPAIERWDMNDLEDVNQDDLMGDPSAGPLLHTWTPEHWRAGYERTWVRVTALWSRIELLAGAKGYERLAIVGHDSTIALLLLSWLGLDWRSLDHLIWAFDAGSSTKVTLNDGKVSIDWVNRP